MKRILMIAPFSYPVMGAEAIVNINLLRVLSESCDFEIDLISRKAKWETYPSGSLESYGVRLNSLKVIEVDNKINLSTIWLLIKSFIKFGVYFKGSHWAAKALPYVVKKAKEYRYDYVLTKNSPSLLLGWYIKKKFGLKWVASWNDPYPQSKYPEPYGRGVNSEGKWADKELIKIMRRADEHIFPSERLQNYMMQYLRIGSEKCTVIPHAIIMQPMQSQRAKNPTLEIVHSGNLGEYRDPAPLLMALTKVIKEGKAINLTFMGKVTPTTMEMVEKYGLQDHVTIIPPVEYKKSLSMIRDYNVAVIIEAPVAEGIFLPTKVGDFISVGIPIFTVSPENGVLHDMYQKGEICYFATGGDVESITNTLKEIYSDFEKGCLHRSTFDASHVKEQIIGVYSSF